MDYTHELEHQYVLGDMEVFHEFDVSQFITNAKTALTNKAAQFDTNIKLGYHASMLEKAIQNLAEIKLDKASIRAFLSKISDYSRLNAMNIMTRSLDYKKDVIEFRPQFLNQYMIMVQESINKILNNNASTAEIAGFLTGELPLKVKKQVVKTNLPYDLKPKDILKEEYNHDAATEKVDEAFIKDKLLPFVMRYNEIKDEVMAEANSVLNAVYDSEKTCKAMLMAINALKEKQLDSVMNAKVNQAAYNAIRGVLDVISYVVYMMIHKINTVTRTILSCNSLYMKILYIYASEHVGNVNGGMNLAVSMDVDLPNDYIVNTDTHSLVDDLLQGDAKAYELKAQRIYDFHAEMPDIVIKDDPDSGDIRNIHNTYDETKYSDIVSMFDDISNGLDEMSISGEDYLLVIDDIVAKAGFGMVLSERFRNTLNAIDDISDYDAKLNAIDTGLVNHIVYRSCMDELKHFGENMELIAGKCKAAYEKLMLLKRRFELNVNGEFKDLEGVNQIKIFLETLREQFIEVTKITADKFMDRLNKISEQLVLMDNNRGEQKEQLGNLDEVDQVDVTSESISFYDDYQSDFANMEKIYEEEIKDLQMAYEVAKVKIKFGKDVVFTEAPAQANPTVAVNAGGAANAKKAPNLTVNDNSLVSKPVALPAKIGDKIGAKVDTYLSTANRQKNTNDAFLEKYEDGLRNRSYANVSINIVPYFNAPINDLINVLDVIAKNIQAFSTNPQILQTIKDDNDLYAKIITRPTGITPDNLKAQLSKLITGTDNPDATRVAVHNNELKQLIAGEVIPVCKAYYGTTAPQLAEKMRAIGMSFDKTIDMLSKTIESQIGVQPTIGKAEQKAANQQQMTQQVNAATPMQQAVPAQAAAGPQIVNASADVYPYDISIFTEANDPNAANKNTYANLGKWMTKLSSLADTVVTSTINGVQRKINDYFKLLDAIKVDAQGNTGKQQREAERQQTSLNQNIAQATAANEVNAQNQPA